MKCPNCGAEGSGKFCQHCGTQMPEKAAEVPTTIAGAIHGIATSAINEVGKQLEYQREHHAELQAEKEKKEKQDRKVGWIALACLFGMMLFGILLSVLGKNGII